MRVPWLGAPPQRGRERRGSRAGRTEPPCGAGGLGDREEGLDRGVVADLALGVRERVGDLVARRRLLEGHLVRDGVERGFRGNVRKRACSSRVRNKRAK